MFFVPTVVSRATKTASAPATAVTKQERTGAGRIHDIPTFVLPIPTRSSADAASSFESLKGATRRKHSYASAGRDHNTQ